jgi:hypothetical protein
MDYLSYRDALYLQVVVQRPGLLLAALESPDLHSVVTVVVTLYKESVEHGGFPNDELAKTTLVECRTQSVRVKEWRTEPLRVKEWRLNQTQSYLGSEKEGC